jgi:hypothetical protein
MATLVLPRAQSDCPENHLLRDTVGPIPEDVRGVYVGQDYAEGMLAQTPVQ